VIDANPAYWLPGRTAAAQQRERIHPEPDAEQRLLDAISGRVTEEVEEESPFVRASERLERARLKAEERDYERWETARSEEERRNSPSRGNPSRYAYARGARLDFGLSDQDASGSIPSSFESNMPPTPDSAADGARATCVAELGSSGAGCVDLPERAPDAASEGKGGLSQSFVESSAPAASDLRAGGVGAAG
jgi:hypothetical protein